MEIDYKILWIDDEKTAVEGDKEEIGEYLEGLGYEPDIILMSPVDNINDAILEKKWNLILVDYRLSTDRSGTEIIKQIRENELFTEIIFYSSDETRVEEDIKTEALEGVYWAVRGDTLVEKVITVINLTLKKVMDVNTMRGIVLAEVSEMDHKMEDIIRLCCRRNIWDGEMGIINYIIGKLDSSMTSRIKKIEELKTECTLDQCLDYRVIDSYKRWMTVKNIFKKIEDNLLGDSLNILNECKNLLDERNLLAHGRTDTENGVEVVKSNEKIFYLNDEIELRKKLKEQRKNFFELFKILEQYEPEKSSAI